MRGGYPPRALSAQSDTLGPLRDCSGLWMVHDERDPAVESFGSTHGSTEMLDFFRVRCSIVRGKKEGLKFSTKVQLKTFGKVLTILWTTEIYLRGLRFCH